MVSDILVEHGYLFLGSRLKRLAERLQGDAGKIIKQAGLPIQPAQFPLLAALARHGTLTVSGAVEALGVSQPAVTRTATSLVELGFVQSKKGGADGRSTTLSLTAAGKRLVAKGERVIWPSVDRAVAELCQPLEGTLLEQIAALERELDRSSLEERVHALGASDLRIREYEPSLAAAFHDINVEWISNMFAVEDNDRRILERPQETIIDRGGVILFVESRELGVVGTCALIKIDEGVFELTKMGVAERARGRKAGELLLRKTLERARALGVKTLYLLTNKKCAAAIHLYEKAGFQHDAEIMESHGKRYVRCDVAMRFPL
jgi:DNA-binding MarR family transcriptional regulator/N-acetylglutamate synthase-like GNAT family acetyltransferase